MIDRKIVDALRKDGRQSNLTLADRVGLSPSACSRRVRALEVSGVIIGYRADINLAAIDLGLSVFVQIGLQHHDVKALAAFEKAVQQSPNIFACDMVSGRDDYLLKVGARDMADYERVHREQLSQLPGVTRIESFFSVRNVIG